MINYYLKFLEKQKKIEEENINKQKIQQRIKSKKYYWDNRESILEKNKSKKIYRSEYFKEWYQKNKLNNNKSNNNKSNKLNNSKLYNNKIKEKPNFTITFN